MIVAELRILPLGAGTSMQGPLQQVKQTLDSRGLKYEIGAMGTSIQAESLQEILDAAGACHEAIRHDLDRVITELAIDDRRDKAENIDSLKRV